MNFTDKIAALPKWMVPALTPEPRLSGPFDAEQYWMAQCEAALARLELAREWIASMQHPKNCPWQPLTGGREGLLCTCNRDALLKALEPPCS